MNFLLMFLNKNLLSDSDCVLQILNFEKLVEWALF
jgi:hypothetical protein